MTRSFEQMANQLEGILGYRPGEDYLRPLIQQLQEYDRLTEANGSGPGKLTATRTDTQAIFELIQKLYELAQAEKPADGSRAFLEQVAVARGKYVAAQRRAEARKRTAGRVAAGVAGASVLAALANAAGATPDLQKVPEPLRQVLEMLTVVNEDAIGGQETPPSVQTIETPSSNQTPIILSNDVGNPSTDEKHLSNEAGIQPGGGPLEGIATGAYEIDHDTVGGAMETGSSNAASPIGEPKHLEQPVPNVTLPSSGGTGAVVDPPIGPPDMTPPEPANQEPPSASGGPPDELPVPTVPAGAPNGDGPGWSESAPGQAGNKGVPAAAPGAEHRPASPGQSVEAPGQQGNGSTQPSSPTGRQNDASGQQMSPADQGVSGQTGGTGQPAGAASSASVVDAASVSTEVPNANQADAGQSGGATNRAGTPAVE